MSLWGLARETTKDTSGGIRDNMVHKDLLEIVVEIFVLALLIKPMFGLGVLTGVGFLFAIVGSAWDGSLFTKKNISRYLLGGTVLIYVAGQVLFVGLKSREIVSFILLVLVGLSIWFKGYFLRRGIEI